MPLSKELLDIGVVRKTIDREVDPNRPIHWSMHAGNLEILTTTPVRCHCA